MITINFEKSIEVAHSIRRQKRNEEFQPFDQIVSAQITGQTESAENERKKISQKHDDLQKAIDSCKSVEDVKNILNNI